MSASLDDIAAEDAYTTEYPYPGLRPFEPHEANIFFGRKRHITDLLKLLNSHRFLAVVGPSGCGKSSLIRAGMIPALQAGFMNRSKCEWSFAVLRPGNQPLLRLATALRNSGIFGEPGSDASSDADQLREDLEAGSRSLVNRLLLNESAQGTNLLILVDQFEELFRFEREGGGDESRAFVNLLIETARENKVSAYVVLTMRTDFLGQCPVFAGLPEALNDSQYLTPRLTREQIEEAVVGPARLFGADVQADVVARILNEMGTDPDQLPLMQHLLMRMWRRALHRDCPDADTSLRYPPLRENSTQAAPDVQLTMEDYEATGGLLQALSKHAQAVYEGLESEREQALVEQMFRRLTGVAPNGQLVRRSPAPEFSTLCEKLGVNDENELRTVIDKFRISGRSFLMPPITEKLKSATPIDISHESLIRKWKLLQDWTRDEACMAEVRRDIGNDAARWEAGGRSPGDTEVPQSRLDAALAWSAKHQDVPPLVKEFLEACICRRDAAQRQKLQKLLLTLAAVAFSFLSIAAGSFWYLSDKQRKETDTALAQSYWRDAVQRLPGSATKGDDLAVGMLWLAEAYYKDPKRLDPAKADLYEIRFCSALAQHPKLRHLWHHDDMSAVASSRDGRYVLTTGTQGGEYNLRIWDASRGRLPQVTEPLHWFKCEYEVNTAEFSGDGQYLLAAMGKKGDATSEDDDAVGELAVWHWPEPGKPPQLVEGRPLADSGRVLAAAFVPSPDISPPPRVIAIIQEPNATKKGSTTKVKLWRSLQGLPEDLRPRVADAETPGLTAGEAAANEFAANMLTVSPDGRFVATWGASKNVYIWNVEDPSKGVDARPTGSVGRSGEELAEVTYAVFSSTGDWLATVDRKGGAQLWDASTQEKLLYWKAHVDAATHVAFSPDERQLVTAGEDCVANVWDISDIVTRRQPVEAKATKFGYPVERRSLDEHTAHNPTPKSVFLHESRVTCSKFSPDGRQVATASQDRTVRIWDAATGLLVMPQLHHALSVSSVEFSPDGFRILTRMRDTAQIWDLAAENPLPSALRTGERLMNTAAAYSGNGKFVATFGEKDGVVQIRVWDVVGGRCTHLEPLSHANIDSIDYACISNDGCQVLTVGTEARCSGPPQNIARLWGVNRRTPVELVIDTLCVVRCAAFSSDGKLVLTASEPQVLCTDAAIAVATSSEKSPKWQVQVWNADTGVPLLRVPLEQSGPVNHIVWSEQGYRLVISAGDANDETEVYGGAWLCEWDVAKSQLNQVQKWTHDPPADKFPKSNPSSNAVRFAAFSPDGEFVATGGADDAAYLWLLSPTPGSSRSPRLNHDSDVVHLTFSSRGDQLATTSIRDNKTCVWDVQKIRSRATDVDPTYTFPHPSRINRAAFSKDGRLLATVSNDQIARVWCLASGGDLAAAFKHDSNVQTASFADDGDGSRLMTVSNDGLMRGAPPWPRRWEWRLKPHPKTGLLSKDADELREGARLLAASELDPQRDFLLMLDNSARSESKTAAKVEELWRSSGGLLPQAATAPQSHLKSANASEAARQWFATAWHLEREILASQSPTSFEEKRRLAELHTRWGWALVSQNQTEQAKEKFSKAIDLEPDQWRRWSDRASFNSGQKKSNFAIEDWSKAIQLAPETEQPELLGKRASEYSQMKNWSLAASDFAAQFKAAPTVASGYKFALTHLQTQADDRQAYRDICDELLRRFGDSCKLEEANMASWTCMLGSDGQQNHERVTKIAEHVVRQGERDKAWAYVYLNTLGAAYYRAGRFQEAKDTLDQSRRANKQLQQQGQSQRRDDPFDGRQSIRARGLDLARTGDQIVLRDEDGTIWDWLFLAMTCKQMKESEAAQKWLDQARKQRQSQASQSWIVEAQLNILFAEATTLIEPSSSKTSND
jgi:WD40 repeat protein/tetratricopeptide (TPR) repeat protein